jgi:peptidoglycan/LPS O-acetylase OafA/YrhL
MSLESLSKDRNNNLNIMRFIAALMVIFSHSVPLTRNHSDILTKWTGGTLGFGGIAVGIFFVTGGYLIARSAEGKKTASKYFTARCLRIFPQLIFVTVLTALFLGPLVSDLPLKEYFFNSQTWKYLMNCVFILQHHLPGVFEQNVYGSVVNGALWTLPVEFMCYIMCFITYKLGFFSEKRFLYTIPFAFFVVVVSSLTGSSYLISVFRPVVLFYIGIGLYVYRKHIAIPIYGFLSCIWSKT